jgi:hypothetical protein
VAVVVAGCGSSTSASGPHKAARIGPKTGLPAGWRTVRLGSGATLPYPPGWRVVHSDTGAASAALFNADGTIRAYLNATPAIAKERFTGWARFRVGHNADEGDRNVRVISAQTEVRVGAERGSCVTDQYLTSRTRYRELACIVAPASGGARTVLVAAAQPDAWARERRALTYALDHFAT